MRKNNICYERFWFFNYLIFKLLKTVLMDRLKEIIFVKY